MHLKSHEISSSDDLGSFIPVIMLSNFKTEFLNGIM